MAKGFWINTRDKPGLLISMMRHLAGNAHISFEGDLSRLGDLLRLSGSSDQETPALRRQTSDPLQDLVVVPLEVATIPAIVRELSQPGLLTRDVFHVQIEKNGTLEFGAYDNFHPECIACSPRMPVEFLQQLQAKGIIRSWKDVRAPSP